MINFINTGLDDAIIKSILNSSPKVEKIVLVHDHKKGDYWSRRQVNANVSQPSNTNIDDKYKDNLFMDLKSHKVMTLQEVQQHFNPKEYNSFPEYLNQNYFVSDGKNCTTHVYRISYGVYTGARFNSVHRPVIDKKLAEATSAPEGTAPICYLFGGGSASGKSTVVNAIVNPLVEKSGVKFAYLDCDELKQSIPEYQMFTQQNPDTAAARVHRESSDLCNECIDAMIHRKKCFMWDGCMGNAERYKKLVDKLKKAGYKIHIVAVDIPTSLAIQRSKQRSRKIDESVVTKSHADFSKAFPAISQLPVDSFSLFDNSGDAPVCIINNHGIQNQELYNKFMEKGR